MPGEGHGAQEGRAWEQGQEGPQAWNGASGRKDLHVGQLGWEEG